jgi:hypothetical protein
MAPMDSFRLEPRSQFRAVQLLIQKDNWDKTLDSFPFSNFRQASSASEELIGRECTATSSSAEASSFRIHAMMNCSVIFMTWLSLLLYVYPA